MVGIGLNVNGTAFPPELADRATSLRLALGRPFDRAAVLAAVLAALEPRYDDFRAGGPAAAVAALEPARRARRALRACGSTARRSKGSPWASIPTALSGSRGDDGRVHRVLSGEIAHEHRSKPRSWGWCRG